MTKSSDTENQINPQNASFLMQLYDEYLADNYSVDAEWRRFFSNLPGDASIDFEAEKHASWAVSKPEIFGTEDDDGRKETQNEQIVGDNGDIRLSILDSLRAIAMIRAYRIRGHLKAKLDTLNLNEQEPHAELDPSNYGFESKDWDRPIFIDNALGFERASLRQIMHALEKTYCGSIGVEFMHIQDPEQKKWIQNRIEEIQNQTDFTILGKKTILERVKKSVEK